MSFAFLPLYTGDYLRDTRHLSPLRHGIYLLLLFYCWDQKGPLPLDEQECAGIANCRSQDDVDALRYVLGRFFVKMEDGWYNRRMQREVERASALSIKRKSAGAKGYQAKAKQLPTKSLASASTLTPTPTLTPSPTTTENQLLLSGKPDVAVPLRETAKQVLEFLNAKTGRRYQPVRANLALIEARLRDGATADELRAVVAKKCREWRGDPKMNEFLRPKTLFNATNFASYQGELHAVS